MGSLKSKTKLKGGFKKPGSGSATDYEMVLMGLCFVDRHYLVGSSIALKAIPSGMLIMFHMGKL